MLKMDAAFFYTGLASCGIKRKFEVMFLSYFDIKFKKIVFFIYRKFEVMFVTTIPMNL